MPDKPDERLIILLPPDLLEEVRRAAEEADLSVSQIVRRAIRNELKSIATKKDFTDIPIDEKVKQILVGLIQDGIPIVGAGASGSVPLSKLADRPPKRRLYQEKVTKTETATIVRSPRERR